jgi:hypothetical protein
MAVGTAYEAPVLDLGFPCAIDLSTGLSGLNGTAQFLFVATPDSITIPSTVGEVVLGVCMVDTPLPYAGATFAASVRLMGVAKVVAGAAITAGQLVMTNASGEAIPYVANAGANHAAGMALDDAAGAGSLIPVLLTPGGAQS